MTARLSAPITCESDKIICAFLRTVENHLDIFVASSVADDMTDMLEQSFPSTDKLAINIGKFVKRYPAIEAEYLGYLDAQ